MKSILMFIRGLARFSAAAALFVLPAVAMAQGSYPTKSIRVVVAAAPGGFIDVIVRLVGQKLGGQLGQPVVIDNRGGAGGNLAARIAVAASPDGYTLLATTPQITISPSLYKNLGYVLLDDFAPVALTGSTPGVFVVHPSHPANSFQDLIRHAKKNRLTYATAGIGTSSHIAADYMFRVLAEINSVHVPYPGGAPAISAVVGNQMELVYASMPAMVELIKQGRLKPLAVSSLKRVNALPNVPTVTEAGFADFEERSWVGFFAPARISRAIVGRLNGEINNALAQQEIRERFTALGMETQPGSAAEFEAYVKKEVAKWARFVKATGVTVE